MKCKVQCIYLGQIFFFECIARDYAEARKLALIQNPNATVLSVTGVF